MAKVNRNRLAKEITEMEGKLNETNIGDVKEVLRVLFTGYTLEEVVEIWQAYNKS